jgi:hypothetical protein
MKLSKFYELISRNARVTLANGSLDKVYFDGALKDVPDRFDDAEVLDFTMSCEGDILFKIKAAD